FGVANGQPGGGRGDVHIFKRYASNGTLRETDDQAGSARTAGGEIFDSDIPEGGGSLCDWLSGIFPGDFGIVAGDCDGWVHVGHGDIRIGKVLDRTTSATRGLDSNAVFGVLELTAFNDQVAHATWSLAADRKAVAVQKNAIGYRDIFAAKL